MHYSLAQCKALAQALLHPEDLDLGVHVQINLDHQMPWPSDYQVKETVLGVDGKSKKKAAVQLGITKRCLRRRLKEMKEFGQSTGPATPVTVMEILNRLLRDQTLMQISTETEINQAWICRLLCNLFIAYKLRYDKPDVRPRAPQPQRVTNTSITAPQTLVFETTTGTVARIRYTVTSTPWFQSDVTASNSTGYQWINMSDNGFTTSNEDVSCDYGDEETQIRRPSQNRSSGETGLSGTIQAA